MTRINPRLFKETSNYTYDVETGKTTIPLACYSVVAVASIECTISIWKPQMSKPFAVILDIFKMGITDMTWAFNGNILLVSSNDGEIFFIHFKPGSLG